MKKDDKIILVWRSAALGDFILSTPALRLIREHFPDHRIVLITTAASNKLQREKVGVYTGGEKNYPWVKLAMPHLIDEVITVSDFSFRGLVSLYKSISEYNFKFSIMMVDPCAPYLGRLKKFFLLYFLTRNFHVYGWGGWGTLNTTKSKRATLKSRGLLKHHVFGPARFMIDMKLFKDIPEDALKVDLKLSSESILSSLNILKTVMVERKTSYLIAFAPGTVQPHKSWPLVKYRELAGLILNEYDAKIIILGTSGDYERAKQIVTADADNIYNLCGKTSVEESAAIFKEATIVVGNDGGAIHLADAMGVPVIALTPGIEYPDSIEPWNNRLNSIRFEISCAPCYSFTHCPMGHNRCMNDIDVSIVLNKIHSLLQDSSKNILGYKR